ncbi:type I polyketide synthase [Pseudoalteromonas luteoviolacea]|uniref:type I polyketide synthase n=1 Tax=Pseudoalteromonas luteoviolacea TaxID=43657 RepID=UPI001F2208B0|nr:type I polyketide synthase [Pseudoalteromonas luteoviolacea]MCF6439122.1 type I polyketide synthase [Pseudoalteromonas luteoviolacea]
MTNLPNINDSDIAIIGMSCRFPGAKSIETFWHNLKNGVESITAFSDEELLDAGVDQATLAQPEYVKAGGVLPDIDMFDAEFFGFTPREAEITDPQERIFLECAWEALEDSGYTAKTHQYAIGVYASANLSSYIIDNLQTADKSRDVFEFFPKLIGNDADYVATRVSYELDLTGPSMGIATACSSALVGVHVACQNLLNGECDMALAGGVGLVLPQKKGYVYYDDMHVSDDGHCRAFDAQSTGTVFTNGMGVVILKRLDDALADGDIIHAVIKGSAVNNDGGMKVGYMAPSVEGQADVIADALAVSGVDPNNISYVEAHGTGTRLGDPIEIEGLSLAFEARTGDKLPIGTVKSNIGHIGAAAGIAGLIKTVLALKHQQLPPSLHYNTPNPNIDFDDNPFYVNSELADWQANDGQPRCAGVSSFGIGGTNAHVILQEAPVLATQPESHQAERPKHVLTLSGKSADALNQQALNYANYLDTQTAASLADVCFSAANQRTHFAHRLTLVASSIQDAQQQLRDKTYHIDTASEDAPKLAFLFTGQGAQYLNMGKQLFETQPLFRESLEHCDDILRPLDVPLLDLLYSDNADAEVLNQTVYTQPVLFSLEYALAKLWLSWGVRPDAVMGHSVGEYVAACIADVFSLKDGLTLIAARGRLMHTLCEKGAMLALPVSETQALSLIAPVQDKVSIGAINGPDSVVVSGDSESIAALSANLAQQGIKAKPLAVSHAFHSSMMAPMLAEFKQVAASIDYALPTLPVCSNVTGENVSDALTDPEYWVKQVRQPVRFSSGVQTLEAQGVTAFIEIGPKPVLLGMASHCFTADTPVVQLPSLREGEDDWQQILESLGQWHACGGFVDWQAFDKGYGRNKVSLPSYPFQRQRYWIEAEKNATAAQPEETHPLLEFLFQGDLAHFEQFKRLNSLVDDKVKAMEPHERLKLLQVFVEQDKRSRTVTKYYDSTANLETQDYHLEEGRFLNFGPFFDMVPGFSWVLAFSDAQKYPEHSRLVLNAQKSMREVLFRKVDFDACEKVMDFGCGFGTDICVLARKHSHLQLRGYSISGEQLEAANKKIAKFGLEDRVAVFNRDSAIEEFPDQFDLIFGFEVALHIKNKTALFANIGNHLNQGGKLVLADIISNTLFDIDHGETSSFLITKDEWVEQLTKNNLKVVDCIDASHEIANFLEDPHFEENLATFDLTEEARAGIRSHNQLGGLLRRELASFVLLTAEKDTQLSAQELRRINEAGLSNWMTYTELLKGRPTQALLSESVYETRWQPSEISTSNHDTEAGHWLIFADAGEQGQQLAEQLEKAGHLCTQVYAKNGVAALTTSDSSQGIHYHLDPSAPAQFKALLATVCANETTPLKGVVHLWSLDTPTSTELSATALTDAQSLSCASVLHLLQAQAEHAESCKLWLVTRNAVQVAQQTHPLNIAQSSLWGLGKVIAQEHPQLWGGIIDNPSVGDLVREIISDDHEDQVAYTAGARHVPRVISAPQDESATLTELNAHSRYLITGGLGGLGLMLANWMVEKGARKLVLTGRSAPSDAANAVIAQLQARGAEIQLVNADIADEVQATRLFNEIAGQGASLKGIIHAAGVMDQDALTHQGWARFSQAMSAKVEGSWHLHQLSKDLELDFFVCFSSLSALLGGLGMGSYVAANTFMDALAQLRAQQGLPALSVNWGVWADGGMSADIDEGVNKSQSEFILDAASGLAILDNLITRPDVTCNAVLPGDSAKFLEMFYPVQVPPFLSELTRNESDNDMSFSIKHLLEQASAEDHARMLAEFIQSSLAEVLRMDTAQVDVHKHLNTMGLDSLRAVEFRNRIRTELNIDIPMANIMNDISVMDLAGQLGALLVQTPTDEKEALLNQLDSAELSGEQIDALFDEYFG